MLCSKTNLQQLRRQPSKLFLKNKPVAYFVSSMLAGMFIAFGVFICFTMGSVFQGEAAQKLVMGITFSVALSLVVIAGAELFTGNNLVMTAGALNGTVGWGSVIKLFVVCYIGNWIGSVIAALLFSATGLLSGDLAIYMAESAATKMAIPVGGLIARAIFCNMLVCLAVWCGFRCKNEAAKLIMIMLCILTFVACGFEHSVANMSMLTLGLLAPAEAAVSIGGYFYNILLVTVGNMIGGMLFVAVPYYMFQRNKKAK